VNILEPREGIGRHCLPKDTKMFLQSSSNGRRSKILTAAIETDGDYRTFRTKLDKGRSSPSIEDDNTTSILKRSIEIKNE
jgi:UDP-N-acetyl-D-mannosaminuronic acid dehydrogenase